MSSWSGRSAGVEALRLRAESEVECQPWLICCHVRLYRSTHIVPLCSSALMQLVPELSGRRPLKLQFRSA